MTTPTPRTDAAIKEVLQFDTLPDSVDAEFARQLERDLAARDADNAALALKLDQLDQGWAAQHAFQRDAKELAQSQLAARDAELAQARTTAQFHKDNHLAAEAELARVKAEREAARKALAIYGRHLDSCGDQDAYNGEDIVRMCGCGLDAAIAARTK